MTWVCDACVDGVYVRDRLRSVAYVLIWGVSLNRAVYRVGHSLSCVGNVDMLSVRELL